MGSPASCQSFSEALRRFPSLLPSAYARRAGDSMVVYCSCTRDRLWARHNRHIGCMCGSTDQFLSYPTQGAVVSDRCDQWRKRNINTSMLCLLHVSTAIDDFQASLVQHIAIVPCIFRWAIQVAFRKMIDETRCNSYCHCCHDPAWTIPISGNVFTRGSCLGDISGGSGYPCRVHINEQQGMPRSHTGCHLSLSTHHLVLCLLG